MAPTTLTGPIQFPFTAIDLTAAIEVIPNMYGLLQAMNLMPGAGVSTTVIRIDIADGVLNILPVRDRGAPPSQGKRGDEKALFLEIPHIPHMDTVRPEDLQDRMTVIGGQLRQETLADRLPKILQAIRNKHAITLEFMRMGALKGVIKDGENNTLYDLYDVFGITKKSVDFALDNAATDVRAKCYEVKRHIEDNLKGEVMSGVEALVSGSFFDALVSHANVEKFFVNWQAASGHSQDMRDGFPFGGLVFREYRGSATDATGTTRKFIADDAGHAFPTGTMNTFATHFGPPNHIEMVNMVGPEIFVSPKVLDHGQGVELRSESNPLPVCRRPALLVELAA